MDVVITNTPDSVLTSEVVPHPVADHDLVSVTVNISKQKRPRDFKFFRDLSQYDSDTLCALLLDESDELNTIFNTDNVNLQVNTLTTILNKCPIVVKEIHRPPAPWLTDEIRQVMTTRNIARQNLKLDRSNPVLQTEY